MSKRNKLIKICTIPCNTLIPGALYEVSYTLSKKGVGYTFDDITIKKITEVSDEA